MSTTVRNRPPSPGGVARALRPRRALVIGGLLLLVLLGAVAAAAYIDDQSHRDHIAPGVRIGGVDVGGLSVDAARARLIQRAVAPRRRTLTVHGAGRTFVLSPGQSRLTADLDVALSRARADSRRGWLGARVLHDLKGERLNERIALKLHYAPGVLPALVSRVAAAVHRAPRDASVTPSATGLTVTPSHAGRALAAPALRRQLAAALLYPSRSADIATTTNAVAPTVSTAHLAAKEPAYIIIDRHDHVLRFFDHLKPSRTFPIAVGRQGLETPPGLYDVQWKQTNPSWYVPNSAWAGKLAGTVVPPGPGDPIKARWMAFNGGAGIHGIDPSEYGSIGHDASHGCVRMRIPDVISLYARTPVGTPVYVA
ncbi:MAG TPA: L,D-transpeptidase family protein [Solirubrobacteraceae bacterium]|nr:L,D-transpeptidase family protein [Solirubrobacteraceae bacterium]